MSNCGRERAHRPMVDTWLDNFTLPGNEAARERLHALFLLSNFMYFGSKENAGTDEGPLS